MEAANREDVADALRTVARERRGARDGTMEGEDFADAVLARPRLAGQAGWRRGAP